MHKKKCYVILSKKRRTSKFIYGSWVRSKEGLIAARIYKKQLELTTGDKFIIK